MESQNDENSTDLIHAIAVHHFVGQQRKELSFKKDDRIIILKKHVTGWALGKIIGQESTGWFPLGINSRNLFKFIFIVEFVQEIELDTVRKSSYPEPSEIGANVPRKASSESGKESGVITKQEEPKV